MACSVWWSVGARFLKVGSWAPLLGGWEHSIIQDYHILRKALAHWAAAFGLIMVIPPSCCLVIKSCPTLCDPLDCSPARLLCPWDFPGKNTGMGCHFLLQGIFLDQGSNLHFLHWQVDSLPLNHPPYIKHFYFIVFGILSYLIERALSRTEHVVFILFHPY